MELANIIVIKRSTSYLHSELFQWTAPFVFSLTAVFTRRAAEWTVVPLLEASKMSTVSLGLGVLFTRLAQSAVIDDVRLVVLELLELLEPVPHSLQNYDQKGRGRSNWGLSGC